MWDYRNLKNLVFQYFPDWKIEKKKKKVAAFVIFSITIVAFLEIHQRSKVTFWTNCAFALNKIKKKLKTIESLLHLWQSPFSSNSNKRQTLFWSFTEILTISIPVTIASIIEASIEQQYFNNGESKHCLRNNFLRKSI